MDQPSTRDATRLSVERTWLARERTLMSWVRTAISLITFGFTIDKFFQLQPPSNAVVVHHLIDPQRFALMMIGTGLVALALAAVEHHRSLARLQEPSIARRLSVAGVVAALVSIMGLVALADVLLHE